MQSTSTAAARGDLSMVVRRDERWPTVNVGNISVLSRPRPELSPVVNAWRTENYRNVDRGRGAIEAAHRFRIATFFGALFGRVLRGDGTVENLGLMGLRVVTTVGCGFIVDAFQNLTEVENMKYHGFGTGAGAEASANTALSTELTTEYVTNNVRPTGTTTEASATVYRTVATLAPDSGGTLAITEHGIFDQASNAGGVLLDKTLFSAVNLVAGSDSLQVTYDLTFTAGG